MTLVNNGDRSADLDSVTAVKRAGRVLLLAGIAICSVSGATFAADTPLGTSNGGSVPGGKTRRVEVVVNGTAIASKDVPADDKVHDVSFDARRQRAARAAHALSPAPRHRAAGAGTAAGARASAPGIHRDR